MKALFSYHLYCEGCDHELRWKHYCHGKEPCVVCETEGCKYKGTHFIAPPLKTNDLLDASITVEEVVSNE